MVQITEEERLRRKEKGRISREKTRKLREEEREEAREREFWKDVEEYHPDTLGFTFVSREDVIHSYDDLRDVMFGMGGEGAITFYRDFDYELVQGSREKDPRMNPLIAPVVSDDYEYVIETGKIDGSRFFNGRDDLKRFFIAMARNEKVSRLKYDMDFGGTGDDRNNRDRYLMLGRYTIFTIL